MIVTLFAAHVQSIDDYPLSSFKLSASNTSFAYLYTFNITNCPSNQFQTPKGTRCRPIDENQDFLCFNDDDPNITCNISLQYGYYCFENSIERDNYTNSIKKSIGSGLLYDDFSDEHYNSSYSDTYFQQILNARITMLKDPDDLESNEFIANGCALSHYNPNSPPCQIVYQELYEKNMRTAYGYQYWRLDSPFVIYGSGIRLSTILDEEMIVRKVNFNSPLEFYVAEYSPSGQFIQMKKLGRELQQCTDKESNMDQWRNLGYNTKYECLIDLSELFDTETINFFDPFYVDGYTTSGDAILRPIPVVDKNHRNSEGSAVNRGSDNTDKRAFRRFFIKDNYTSNDVGQYLKSAQIRIQMKGKDKIAPPVFEVEYYQFPKDKIVEDDSNVYWSHSTISHPQFTFEVIYSQSYSSFWTALIIVFSIFCALSLVFWLYRMIVFMKTDGDEGFTLRFIIGAVAKLFDILGTSFFIVMFAFSLYMFIFFKAQSSAFFFIPSNDELDLLPKFMWVAFALKLAASVLYVIYQTGNDILLVDFEKPEGSEKNRLVGWRRILIANEWCQLNRRRYSSPVFTVLLAIFLLRGLNLETLSNPIPTGKLISGGEVSLALEFAFISIIWLLSMLVEWVVVKFIVHPIFGNPYLNFVDLCSNSNISAIMLMSSSHGFYIHGQSSNGQTEKSMDGLGENLNNEVNNIVPTRGLVPGKDDQVFEFFLEKNFRADLQAKYSHVMSQTGSPSVLSIQKQTAGSIPNTHAHEYESLNTFLIGFIRKTEKNHHYIVQQPPWYQNIIGAIPTVIEDSIFSISSEIRYQKALLSGIEWKLMLFYLLLFSVIQMSLHNPAIAGFVVLIADLLVMMAFRIAGKANLSKKLLLDDRLFVDY